MDWSIVKNNIKAIFARFLKGKRANELRGRSKDPPGLGQPGADVLIGGSEDCFFFGRNEPYVESK